jgi:hypothetical protein
MPLGGSEKRPGIPLLTDHPDPQSGGMTMADYAARSSHPQQFAAPSGPSIIQEEANYTAPQTQVQPKNLNIQNGDLLAGDAQRDPEFRQGPGSFLAINQPRLAAKYGVIRDGQFIPPQMVAGQQGRSLSPQTIQGLKEIAKFQNGGGVPSETDAEARKAVEDGIGGAAARAANMPGDHNTDAAEEEDANETLKQAIGKMDAFEFNEWRNLMMREMLNSEKQREIIESRLAPLELDSIIMTGHIRQVIPIVPGKYEIELQTHDGHMSQAIKRLIMNESKSLDVSDHYYLEKYSYMSIAVSLYRVNDRVFPTFLDENGNFKDDLFYKKFNMVMKLPLHMLASIGVQAFWFELRVRKLFKAEVVGNG